MKRTVLAATALTIVGMVGCSAQADVEKVPVGADVQLVRQDGGVVEGTLTAKTPEAVQIASGRSDTVVKTVAREEIADLQVVEPGQPADLPAIAKFREYTVPEGAALALALDTPVSSETSKAGDAVAAHLTEAVTIDGDVVLPAGLTVRGTVVSATSAGKVKGRASVSLAFATLEAYDDKYPIAARWAAEAKSTKGQDAAKIGIGAGAGAIIGGILSGKQGAAAGAAIGGGGGTVLVLTTEGKPIVLGVGDPITVKLADAVEVRVPVRGGG